MILGGGACAPNPKYPYEREPNPRKTGDTAGTENGYEITVFGNVERPGTFSPKPFITVLDALQLAGGLSRLADKNHITIRRKDREIPFVYDRATGERPEMNLVLLPGDIVTVP
jgi:protein involved in polysaccharide export with SLBB domain